jgi:tRNA (guanine-N7-)-methyltransferase
VYQNPSLPLHLDIGSARGKFLLKMALLSSQINFLGVEIREPLVREANQQREQEGLTNLHFLFGNINNSFSVLLESLPVGVLHCITIQFPDPWFKQRHSKRRVVQPELVDCLVAHLVEGGTIFLQSDVESVAREMGERFEVHPHLKKQHSEEWLSINPFPIPTEREIATLAKNQPVYRVLLRKN